MKLLIYLTLWSVSHAAYMNRMAILSSNPNLSQNRIRPTAFRPGVMIRPWMHPRLVQGASHRVPYYVYRNNPHRYSAMKHYTSTRMVTNPWRAATRVPAITSPTSAEYDFVRAATRTHEGAIHTIPAPNLSLSEKPIVVLEMDKNGNAHTLSTEAPKLSYQVTEKFPDLQAKIEQPIGFSKTASLAPPELQSLVRNGAALQLASELGLPAIALPQTAFQQPVIQQPPVVTQPNLLPHLAPQNFLAQPLSIQPQQFSLQNFHRLPNPQDVMQVSSEGIVITPNALYQSDPEFLQKLQNHLMQRFPGVEFVPYPAEIPAQVQTQNQPQNQVQTQSQPHNQVPTQSQPHIQVQTQNQYQNQVETQNQPQNQVQPQVQQQTPIFLLQNEQITKQTPSQFVPAEPQNQKNVYLRETQEGTFVTLVPQVTVNNATENQIEITSLSPQNFTVEFVAAESKPHPSTVKYVIETTTEEQKSTPVYHPPVTQRDNNQVNQNQIAEASQIIQNVVQGVVQASNQNDGTVAPQPQNTVVSVQTTPNEGNVVTDGYYSTVSDVRPGVTLVQAETPRNISAAQENITSTTTHFPTSSLNDEMKNYFVQHETKDRNSSNPVTELKPVLGVPFAKAQNSVNVAYTIHRSDDKEAKVAKDGSVYAGQIVEASVSEDHDFNKQKANLLSRRAPIRLLGVADNKNASSTTTTPQVPQKVTVVKARIPPRSKLTFDDKTGEPVLRIYASYVNNSAQKETIASRLSNTKREIAFRNKDRWKETAANKDSWKDTTVKALAKPHGFEPSPNQVTEFGQKLRSRSDDYVPLFEDYEY